MSTASSSSAGGISLIGAVFIVFLVLKLTKTITWPWWWVTAPLWAGLALAIVILVFFLCATGVLALIDMVGRK